jgi:hypothetical protein
MSGGIYAILGVLFLAARAGIAIRVVRMKATTIFVMAESPFCALKNL